MRREGGTSAIELDDRFHLGSCGKSFTATVAALLEAEGSLSWDTSLQEVFPELRQSMQARYRAVTLTQLATHRSGLPTLERGTSPFWTSLTTRDREVTQQRQDLVRFAVRQDPLSMPGSSFHYTDLGYAVLGRALERVSGTDWEGLVRSRIARPLGLASLGFGAPGAAGTVDQPWGHVMEDGKLRAIPPGPGADLAAPVIGPAGTIHLSIVDWARYAAMHLEAARGKGGRAAALAVLYEDSYDQGYGMGWALTEQKWAGGRLLSHTGSCGAWAAAIWIAPERNAALVVTSNYGGPEGFAALNRTAEELIRNYVTPRS